MKKISKKQGIAFALFSVMILATPAISYASQVIMSNGYAIGSYLTSGDVSKAFGIGGAVMGGFGSVGAALGLLCGVQTAILAGVAA